MADPQVELTGALQNVIHQLTQLLQLEQASHYRIAQIGMYLAQRELQELESASALKGFRVYSQSNEDGLLQSIFSRLDIAKGTFCEIGVEDGRECNTRLLLQMGWHGCWIEASEQSVRSGTELWSEYIQSGRLSILQSFVTAENVESLIESASLGDIDLLSIDIDGNDLHVWKALGVRPKVVMIEYNAKFPPPVSVVQRYNPSHAWNHRTDDFGASFSALVTLGREKSYTPVACSASGMNVFFVRDDLISAFDVTPADTLYRPPRLDLISNPYFSNHHDGGVMIFDNYPPS